MNANLSVIPSALLDLLREAMGLPLSAHTDESAMSSSHSRLAFQMRSTLRHSLQSDTTAPAITTESRSSDSHIDQAALIQSPYPATP
jgi:hypothetical protein